MKKSHPLRRVVLATAATVSGIVLLLALKPGSDPASASAQGGAAQPPAAGQESPQGGSEQAASGARTVTGSVADTQYGPVQVRLTLSGDKITKAEAVQAPSGGQSTTVTEDAVPKLNQAAVAAGTADIDAVSGATYTSAGYKKSLQSALDQAAESAPAPAESSASPSQPPAASSEAPAPEGQTVDGDVVQTQYGPVQVRLTLNGTTISKAEAIQAPSGGQSTEVTGNAIPKLNQAAAATQSADIDAVSGATYTSAGYKKSLQSALDKAGA
ncbi:FMN-binding protein [Streptomyces sp. NBC_00038]|uniref:FMN-binding protein n=1 Tax=Streptomyces sp. NBC_00038 TaxID=2903615 RepID=UPI002250E85A|nr:FMN-binding protein [Streptomyces sp. NBC_00038]MCX5556281.1 FMN-binding protein [Streptomyces sp. NBC_00038]